jgi:hypothetical protein
VVRDRALPDLYGRYLYADFCTGTRVMAKLKRAMRERLQKKLAKKGKAKVKIIATATIRTGPWQPTRSR